MEIKTFDRCQYVEILGDGLTRRARICQGYRLTHSKLHPGHTFNQDDGPKDMHSWFGLSYANYLVLARSLIQEMPEAWQADMVRLLNEYNDTFDLSKAPGGGNYAVQTRTDKGRFVTDRLADYRRPHVDLINSLRIKK